MLRIPTTGDLTTPVPNQDAADIDKTWRLVLSAVTAAENDVDVALATVNTSQLASSPTASPVSSNLPTDACTAECESLKRDLLESVGELKKHNCIFGSVSLLEQLIDPIEETEIRHSPYCLEEAEIIAQVRYEQAVTCGEVIKVKSDEGSEDKEEPEITTAEMIHACERLKHLCLSTTAKCSLEMLRVLC
jgi:hypothetical protein